MFFKRKRKPPPPHQPLPTMRAIEAREHAVHNQLADRALRLRNAERAAHGETDLEIALDHFADHHILSALAIEQHAKRRAAQRRAAARR